MPPEVPSQANTPPITAPIWVLMFGNFVVACGVLVVPGMLDALARDLQISVPTAGTLLSVAALAMCLGAPLFAAITSRVDRRLLLVAALLLLSLGHLACAWAPDYPTLAIIRPFSILGAAVFSPQAAATIGLMVPAQQRSTAVTTVFLGWSIASVLGMPIGNLIASHSTWRYSFLLIAILALVAALLVWRVIPRGLTVPPLTLASWLQVARSARLRLVVLATFIWCAGHLMALGYITAALRALIEAPATTQALLLTLMGVCGVGGNVLVSRMVARIGPDLGARISLSFVAGGMGLWGAAAFLLPQVWALGLAMMVWGTGSFAFVSNQQARLANTAPALASASLSLNTSSLYAGQALGAALGGLMLGWVGYAGLAPVGACVVALALAVSVWADRRRVS